ncbi:hypothetical protein JQ615_18330 [Bradyrhizobium jicamae]|uniref:TerB N-terminal domain-containing protein n=1 Tax=Bradyrhizobium jicamae TaxID=280332 RepID=A0ABS5FKN3_9BRAD|nr:hypothetical protein [Bradyrhizobium jicamae]MBR0797348.1 hypothetical protein [Bradyrhizobium jicamae]
MSNVLDEAKKYVDMFTTGQFPIPPKADTIAGHVPILNELAPSRDDDGIICQLAAEEKLHINDKTFPNMPTSSGRRMDGGDSAARTGVAAFCNSAVDVALLPRFEVLPGIMVRHPKHFPWNNPKNCTRDQLKAFLSGCWRARRLDIAQRLTLVHASRGYICQNIEKDEPGSLKKPPKDFPDVLGPDDIMYMHICAGEDAMYMDPYGQMALQVAIQRADQNSEVDKTNLMLACIVCGRLNLFVQVHKTYKDMLLYYFKEDPGANRRQGALADELIAVVERELDRYPKPLTDIPLFPQNTIEFLEKVDLRAELNNIDPAHHAELAGRFTQATLKDAAATLLGPMNYSLKDAAQRLKELGASANKIAQDLKDLHRDPTDIQTSLLSAGILAADVQQAVQSAFPGFPGALTPGKPVEIGPIKVSVPDPIKKIIPHPFQGGFKW